MQIRSIALACAIVASLAGCGSDNNDAPATPPAPVATTFTMSGVAASGAPLVGVLVTVTDSKGVATQSSLTDAGGKFSVTVQGTAPFVLTVPFSDADGSPAFLSSVVAPSGSGATVALSANLNPLTSLITQRVLGMVPTAAPTAAQITAANITQALITSTEQSVATALQPAFTALNIPAASTTDPIGAAYQANASDPLDNMFTIARFNVHAGKVSIGTDSDNAVVSIPATGAISAPVPAAAASSLAALNAGPTTTAIQNVIVVVGENQTFDAVFATYQAASGQTVKNLLSQGIINTDGTPGPNFSVAAQSTGATQTAYTINPTRAAAYTVLPQPELIGVLNSSLQAQGGVPDPRAPANLPNGPFQYSKYAPYSLEASNPLGNLTGDPVHRFFQMWQQTGGDNSKLDMFTWVATTAGQGGDTPGVTPANPSQGGELMGFANMATGDAPFFKSLANTYAISDNYHQSIMGGTGANFYSIATADMPYFNNAGVVAAPPANQISNPNPMPQTPNFYTQDGYSGGSYVNCSDAAQPGVSAILNFLTTKNVKSNCEPGKYYLVNNYGLGYDMNGNPQPIGANNFNLPPQTVPTIAEALASKGVAWKWYTGGRELADVSADAVAFGVPAAVAQAAQYNTIGDPLVASSNVITNTKLKAGLAGLTTLYKDIANSSLPAVSFVVPKNLDSGHPGYSVPAKYEGFLQDLIAKVKANPKLWAHTAILITTDEGGGHFDTGAIQNVDFFGDGPRIPLIVVSPLARTNYIDHTYHDHASVLKFIERNWRLKPLSTRSRDNLPNPVMTAASPYLPVNKTPAVGDLMSMFNF
ncbi:alkaline phosphatase family protein [Undibacterium sp.]|uniref:alkaline phosphatase family protein n=1 Tax=Undibacterium sp. TaxID=1914977 RepID=UPI00374DDF54